MKNEFELREQKWDNEYFIPIMETNFTPIIQKTLSKVNWPKDLIDKEIKSSYLFGKIGTGKTVKAAFMMLQEIKNNYVNRNNGQICIFISVPELLFQFKNSYNHQSKETEIEILDKYSKADLLVLDDFGTEKTTDWSFQMLYILINRRYENIKKTIFTSNLSLEQLAEKLGDDRISSRIQSMCDIIKFDGIDYRIKK
jgi:DNA replication protein DnaC